MAIREVLFQNEYKLPERFEPDDRIVDIGAHIGTFAIACLERRAKWLACYEPVKENFEYLDRNLRRGWRRWSTTNGADSIDDPPRIRIHNRAVWRNDEPSGFRDIVLAGPANTAMAWMLLEEDQTTPHEPGITDRPLEQVVTIPFDKVIFDATEGWKHRIRLVKIDAEGSEWLMLEGSQTLGHIDQLVMEVHLRAHHLCGKFAGSLENLEAKLAQAGFYVRVLPHPLCDDLKQVRCKRIQRPKKYTMAHEPEQEEVAIKKDGLIVTVQHGEPTDGSTSPVSI